MSSIDQLFGTKRISDPSKYMTSDPLDYENNEVLKTNNHYYVLNNKMSTSTKILIFASLSLGGVLIWQMYNMWKKIKKLESALKFSRPIKIGYDEKEGVVIHEPEHKENKYFNYEYFDSIKQIKENED